MADRDEVEPTAVPASAKLPRDSRRNMSIEKPTMPTGIRAMMATTSIRATSGWRTNSTYLRGMPWTAMAGAFAGRRVAGRQVFDRGIVDNFTRECETSSILHTAG